jgi:pimeloyl-ACP methyl ester carboxylesterase
MSAITVDGDLVHYEKLGRGRPVILLHGWIGSWRYWIPTMQQLQSKFSVYAIDLFGFGDSSKNNTRYSVDHQVALLEAFVKEMAIPKMAMIVHGLGTIVATEYARRNPDKVARLLLVSAPLFEPPGGFQDRTPPGVLNKLTPPPLQTPPAAPANPAAGGASTPPASASTTPAAPAAAPATAPATNNNTPAAPAPASGTPSINDATIPSGSAVDRAVLARALAGLQRSDAPKNADVNPVIAPTTVAAPAAPPAAAPAPTTPPAAASSPSTTPPNAAPAATPGTAASSAASASAAPTRSLVDIVLGKSNHNPLADLFNTQPEALLLKCFKRSEAAYEKIALDIAKTDGAAMKISVSNFDSLEMLDKLHVLDFPMVFVNGEDDQIVENPKDSVWDYLARTKGDDKLLVIPMENVRHFPMLENDRFFRLATDFLEKADIGTIEVGKRWKRRSR